MHPNKPTKSFQKVITCNHHLSVVLLCKLHGGLEAVFLHEKRKLLLSAARSTLIACMYCYSLSIFLCRNKWVYNCLSQCSYPIVLLAIFLISVELCAATLNFRISLCTDLHMRKKLRVYPKFGF